MVNGVVDSFTKQYSEAVLFAISVHSGQFRKTSKEPFFIHPLMVSEILLKEFSDYKNIKKLRVSAVLHDVLEDTWVSFDVLKEKFGEDIADLVLELSKNNDLKKKDRHPEYLSRLINASDDAKIVKLCDILHNFLSINEDPRWFNFLNNSSEILNNISISEKSVFDNFESLRSRLLIAINKELKLHKA